MKMGGFVLSVKKEYFDLYAQGSKKWEGRLYSQKWLAAAGKEAMVQCSDTKKALRAEILEVQSFKSFEDMLTGRIGDFLPGCSSLPEAVETYRQLPFYRAKEFSRGVLALRVRVLQEETDADGSAQAASDARWSGPDGTHECVIANGTLLKASGGGNIYQCGSPHEPFVYKEVLGPACRERLDCMMTMLATCDLPWIAVPQRIVANNAGEKIGYTMKRCPGQTLHSLEGGRIPLDCAIGQVACHLDSILDLNIMPMVEHAANVIVDMSTTPCDVYLIDVDGFHPMEAGATRADSETQVARQLETIFMNFDTNPSYGMYFDAQGKLHPSLTELGGVIRQCAAASEEFRMWLQNRGVDMEKFASSCESAVGPGAAGHAGRRGGIENVGNTCYLAALLQCLLATPQWLQVMQAHFSAAEDDCDAVMQEHLGRTDSCVVCLLFAFTRARDKGLSYLHELERLVAFLGSHGYVAGEHHSAPELFIELLGMVESHAEAGLLLHKCFRCEATRTTKLVSACSCSQPTTTQKDPKYSFVVPAGLFGDTFCTLDEIIQRSMRSHSFIEVDSACAHCGCQVDTLEERFVVDDVGEVLALEFNQPTVGRKRSRCSMHLFDHVSIHGKAFQLYGVILHDELSPSAGHYIAYVRCGLTWTKYDDAAVSSVPGLPSDYASRVAMGFLRRANGTEGVPIGATKAWHSCVADAKRLGLASFSSLADDNLANSLHLSCVGLSQEDATTLSICMRSYFTCDFKFHTNGLRNDRTSFCADVQAQQLRAKRDADEGFAIRFWAGICNSSKPLLLYFGRNSRMVSHRACMSRGVCVTDAAAKGAVIRQSLDQENAPFIGSLSIGQALRFASPSQVADPLESFKRSEGLSVRVAWSCLLLSGCAGSRVASVRFESGRRRSVWVCDERYAC